MFGDKEAYLNKMCTAARTRSMIKQQLGNEFYEKEGVVESPGQIN